VPRQSAGYNSDEEIRARLATWQRPAPRLKKGYLALYARPAESADKGAIIYW
jgi:dihydroxy-acid dehydratase